LGPDVVAAAVAAAVAANSVAPVPADVAGGVWRPGVAFGEPFSLRGD